MPNRASPRCSSPGDPAALRCWWDIRVDPAAWADSDTAAAVVVETAPAVVTAAVVTAAVVTAADTAAVVDTAAARGTAVVQRTAAVVDTAVVQGTAAGCPAADPDTAADQV